MPAAPQGGRMASTGNSEIVDDDGTRVRVVCGSFWGKSGPVDGVAADPRYLDVFVPPGVRKRLAVETSRNAFAYVFEGAGAFRDASEPRAVQTERVGETDTADTTQAIGNCSLVVFDRGDEVVVQAGEQGVRSCSSRGNQSRSLWRGVAPSS